MDFYSFYRLDFCIRNLGISLIGIFSGIYVTGSYDIFLLSIILLQLILVQMNSFSMNHYFDYKEWNEDNYIKNIFNTEVSELKIIFFIFLPLVFLAATTFLISDYISLLVLYILSFLVYQMPKVRLKKHYFSSIILNSLCLGWILYAYPYLIIVDEINLVFIIFSVIFFCYMAFHEVVHQIAHNDKDMIFSVLDRFGLVKSKRIAIFFLLIPIIVSIYGLYIDLYNHVYFLISIIFSIYRINKLISYSLSKKLFSNIRNSWHKFYSFHEGLVYLISFVVLVS